MSGTNYATVKIHLKPFRSNNKGSPYNDNIIEFLLVKVDLNDGEHEGLPIKKKYITLIIIKHLYVFKKA